MVLKSPHPSGLSAHRGFYGCKHFSQANAFIESSGGSPVDWQIV
jgi:uracil-DNA glycosylase